MLPDGGVAAGIGGGSTNGAISTEGSSTTIPHNASTYGKTSLSKEAQVNGISPNSWVKTLQLNAVCSALTQIGELKEIIFIDFPYEILIAKAADRNVTLP